MKGPHTEPLAVDVPLHVERVGSGDPMVFLHGFGASGFTWRLWTADLARDHALHLVDLRGFGRAPKRRDALYGPSEMADDVRRMILDLDLQRVTLVGHSMGGGVGLLTLLRLRDAGEGWRVRRLVSIAGTAYAQEFPPYVDLLRRPASHWLLRLVPTGWLVRKVIESIVFDPAAVTDEQVEGYAAPLRSWAAKRSVVACASQIVPDDLDSIVARYPEIDVPALLLWGRQDPVVPLAIAERLAGELPDARLVVLERCGHMPPEERPKASLRAVREFLADTDARA